MKNNKDEKDDVIYCDIKPENKDIKVKPVEYDDHKVITKFRVH